MTSDVWTPENTQKLKTLWQEGRTAAWIAKALGPGVSRCAVLSKVYRLGLARGPEARRDRATAPRGAEPGGEDMPAARPATRSSGPPKIRATPRPATRVVVTPSEPTVSILSVRRGQCRWPYGCSGEPGFGLCGRTVARGAFCAAHAEVGYQKRACTAESLLRMVGGV
ncbi:GcrA family cell cycle regulator [Brevundimonas sp.]|uniref:GcrA family cell cycle regulator n=1 Tax=Brevundimonas sp. TaxID=1871086 RepID=UPI0028A620B9|nr:GcrA family cell cycle regulator [Brevundimonas sp.]